MENEHKSVLVWSGFIVLSLAGGILWFENRQQSTQYVAENTAHISAALVSPDALVEVPVLTEERRQPSDPSRRYSVDITYPRVALVQHPELAKEANAVIDAFVQDAINVFIGNVNDITPPTETNALESDYTMRDHALLLSPTVISLRFDHSEYIAGAAHPDNQTRILNYDIERHLLLATSDLFASSTAALPFLSEYTRNYFKRAIPDSNKDDKYQHMVIPGTAPTHENFEEVAITKNGLLVIFDPYQVAPYARGTIEVPIPESDLAGMLSPSVERAIKLATTNITEATLEGTTTGSE